ncbi:Legionaminic acid cytidylyltransferase [plant metagenome]|uniref:Legionaminic acid cytidylyltransferase n=1 Tax=plant metagenome TaxID=1297885 RepID=A0A484VFW9_9ZZZZ
MPLIAHSIAQARDSGLFTAIAVSSDSDAILQTAAEHGVDLLIKRPDELASDHAGKIPAILHALTTAEDALGIQADYLIDLDATSPLRLPSDIHGCVDLLVDTGATSVITGAPAHRSPYFNLVERRTDGTVAVSKSAANGHVLRRQDSPECFDMNASIYGWRLDVFRKDPKVFYPDTRLYEMPRDRSYDIDEELDFHIVDLIMKQRQTA